MGIFPFFPHPGFQTTKEDDGNNQIYMYNHCVHEGIITRQRAISLKV